MDECHSDNRYNTGPRLRLPNIHDLPDYHRDEDFPKKRRDRNTKSHRSQQVGHKGTIYLRGNNLWFNRWFFVLGFCCHRASLRDSLSGKFPGGVACLAGPAMVLSSLAWGHTSCRIYSREFGKFGGGKKISQMNRLKNTLFIVTFSLGLIAPFISWAQSPGELLEQKEEEINQLEAKLVQLKNQSKTLTSQISFMDSQIQVTLLRISQTEDQINVLAGKITRLQTSIDRLAKVLENRVSKTYRQSHTDPLEILFSSGSLPNFLTRFRYLQLIQSNDRKLLVQVTQTQISFEDQKNQEELLKKKLEQQKTLLAQQLKEKRHLLEVTKNDEKKYQSLLAIAVSEQNAIRSAIQSAKLENGTPINKGDTIAVIGNTGYPNCSSGDHLHFEIRKDGAVQNPASYLKSTSIIWDNQPDGQFEFVGEWDFPIGNPRITQGYGMTYWARLGWYSGGPHTGIDMVSDNISIRAPQSGTLYKGSAGCKGSLMNYVAIDHGG